MEWTQLIIFLLSVFGLFIWNRTEARADIRHMDAKLDSNRDMITAIHHETNEKISQIHHETNEKISQMRLETLQFHRETNDLMKDFHYKLLEIERTRNSR